MRDLHQRMAGRKTAVKISVLGCIVNGPGEAREADLGIAAGKGKGVIFKRGEIVRHVLESEMIDALMEEVEQWEKEEAAKGTLQSGTPKISGQAAPKEDEPDDGRVRLPTLNETRRH